MLTALALLMPLQDAATLLVRSGDVLPTPTGSHTVNYIQVPESGVGGGWLSMAWNQEDFVILGQKPGQLSGPVRVLRQPKDLFGIDQAGYRAVSMVNGDIAYVAYTFDGFSFGDRSVWLEDQLVAKVGDTVPGRTDVWTYFEDVHLTTSGTVVVFGRTFYPGGGGVEGDLIVELPGGRVLHDQRVPYANLPDGENEVVSFSISPSGNHWAGVVNVGNGFSVYRQAVIVDGAAYAFPGGELALHNRLIPAEYQNAGNNLRWRGFGSTQVNDRGNVAFTGGNFGFSTLIRDGRAMLPLDSDEGFVGIDERGIILTQTANPYLFLLEGAPLDPILATEGVDVDGDGLADPGFNYVSTRSTVRPGQGALTVFHQIVEDSSGGLFQGVFRARNFRIDRPLCEGVLNSTGHAGQVVVTGDPSIAVNSVDVTAFSLPISSPGYFLVSQTAGLAVGPGGSVGNLCLGGSIGRMTAQLFVADATGRGRASIDLGSVAQPSGSVAAAAGDTWYVQAWHRDTGPAGAVSNFTAATSVTFVD